MTEPPSEQAGAPSRTDFRRTLKLVAPVTLALVGVVALASLVAPTLDVVLLLTGLVLLLGGAEFLVRGSVSLAERLGVGSLLIGLTVVAFGTSAPELVIGLAAVVKGKPDFNIGNVVGSNIANIGLIYAGTALIRSFTCSRRALRREIPIMILVTILGVLAMADAVVSRAEGVIGVLLLGAYVWRSYIVSRREFKAASEEPDTRKPPAPLAGAVVMALAGLLALVGGGHLLIESGSRIAAGFGVPEIVIGLTVVAIGTSLPELATCVVAALRNQPEIVVGNVVGSNLFNLLFVLGITSAIGPIPVSPEVVSVDAWVMLGFAIAMPLVSIIAGRVTRPEGALLVLAYIAYIASRYLMAPSPVPATNF